MQNPLARIATAVGLTLLFGTSAFAQMAPTAAPGTAVKSHVRHLKSGKTILVHGYMRTRVTKMPKMIAVKGYTRHMKSGKTVVVHSSMRHAAKKK